MTNTATNARSGLALVLTGTVVSAASSFIVLLIVAPALGPADYAKFSVYWSALFMVVAILFGVQQESTRGVAAAQGTVTGSTTSARHHKTSVLRFALLIAAALLVLVGATSPLWSEALFGSGTATWGCLSRSRCLRMRSSQRRTGSSRALASGPHSLCSP
ncbi:hypothetical protein G7066_13240 [Leucobacter coleopterorum]|uniref:Uncharacterized protein n=1 Tax=Leucobacter coleopterorum TaxID=2714933 RepID=A0ABX6JZF0_9MICO|nr:hypothetical protein [Leucobacter coleopterorum]QIM19291.1 hypothetical protein G7066_13240 [Leucobacter coleopterorum]